ncbi:hypothetical protein A2G94_06115 [Francisella endosymbiont of Ornithodoros moubata]|nr:hypothetical protein A2G94_06115 [Francisella endosymbiont of Ornithodoros moubata]
MFHINLVKTEYLLWGINTTNNNLSDIKKSILAILYLSVIANIKLSSVVENISSTILSKPIVYLDNGIIF